MIFFTKFLLPICLDSDWSTTTASDIDKIMKFTVFYFKALIGISVDSRSRVNQFLQIGLRVLINIRWSTLCQLWTESLVLIEVLMECQSTVLINTLTRTPLVHMISFSEILYHFSYKSSFWKLDGFIAWYMAVCKLKCWPIWLFSAPNNQKSRWRLKILWSVMVNN